jgi:hypothetical protein
LEDGDVGFDTDGRDVIDIKPSFCVYVTNNKINKAMEDTTNVRLRMRLPMSSGASQTIFLEDVDKKFQKN